MLFKFKSKVTGDVIMLEPSGRRVLQVIGKEPTPTGIIEPSQMQGAIAALEAAVVEEEAQQKAALEQARSRGEVPPRFESVSLRQRAMPFIDMLRRAHKDDEAVTWGV